MIRRALILLAIGLALYGLGLWSACDDQQAMTQCQKAGHSFDTCFYALHR